MKYVRKTVAIILIILFVIALAISAAVATMIKNVNVCYNQGTGEGLSAYNQTLAKLEALKGGNMFLLGDDDVYSCVTDSSKINLISYEKIYPCTLNIVISERVETFYSYSDDMFYVYDEDGVLMYSSAEYTGTEEDGYVLNQTADNSPDVMITYGITQAERTFIADSCATFKQNFGSLRALVKSVYREKTPEYENLVFLLRSGLEIEISNCDELVEEKIVQACAHYETLSDGQKTSGQLRVYTQENSEGTIKSDYIP